MDGPGFGGMNRIGGGMYKHLFFICTHPIFSKLEIVLRIPRKKKAWFIVGSHPKGC